MSKTGRYILGSCLVLFLILGSFASGFAVGWLLPHPRAVGALFATTPSLEAMLSPTANTGLTPTSTATITATPSPEPPAATATLEPTPKNEVDQPDQQPGDLETLFTPFWEVWNLVQKEYVDQPIDQEMMMRGAIRGMLESLGDEHTAYMDPDQFRQANAEMQGDYEGIGAWVDTTGAYVVITSPMPGSPAEKAGLKTGDTIIAVDHEDMTNIDGSLVLRKVLGPAGTQVTLTIRREGVEEPFDVTITRAKITLSSVDSKMVENNIAYIHVVSFSDDTNQELEKALNELLAKNPKGLILDLRNNPGGYLNTAIEVVSQFIPEGVVMYEEYGDGTRTSFDALPGGLAIDIPLVVLVNEGSASASEIVAGAIQDTGRAKLVGMTTYGKGSVQIWTPLSDDQGAVRITVARWLTPKGRQIHKIGLEPDVQVELTEENIKAGLDPQLQKAIELLNQ